MVSIIFETHATSLDNENRKASGHYDVELSALGVNQAKEMGERYRDAHLDAVFSSDLRRSYMTAQIAFDGRFPIIQDARLRECDYGEWTRRPAEELESRRLDRVSVPFPGGESYEQAAQRVQSLLEDLTEDYTGKTALIIGHRATYYSLEHLINGVPLEDVISAPWKWQPGWTYQLNSLK